MFAHRLVIIWTPVGPCPRHTETSGWLVVHPKHAENCGTSSAIGRWYGDAAETPIIGLGVQFRLWTYMQQKARYALRGIPMSLSIPSIRKSTSKRSIVQQRTSSSGSLWGSKFQLSRDTISRCRMSEGMSIGGLTGSSVLMSDIIYINGSHMDMMAVDGALRLHVHLAEQFCIPGGFTRQSSRSGGCDEQAYRISPFSRSSQPPHPCPNP